MRLLTIALIAASLTGCFDIEAKLQDLMPNWCYYPDYVEANWEAYTPEERKQELICEPMVVVS